MLGLKAKPANATATPPAKRWRNYYRIYRVISIARIGTVFPGIHGGPDVFPSKEVAEQRAVVFCRLANPPRRTLIEYVGAYPEGEAAN